MNSPMIAPAATVELGEFPFASDRVNVKKRKSKMDKHEAILPSEAYERASLQGAEVPVGGSDPQ